MADHHVSTGYVPRCPFCANVLKLERSFWERIGLKASKAFCPSCQRSSDPRDAHMMGSAYWHWAEAFRKDLTRSLEDLPMLSEPVMHRALGAPHKDDTRLVPVAELFRACMQFHRSVLIEMARGREATLEVVHLTNDKSVIEVVAILGTASAESGAREHQQLIARHDMEHFVICNHPPTASAEARVKRAIHAKIKTPRELTAPHVAATHHHGHAQKHVA